jgi:Raf kinase inhibitor-like YbhB/YbcL family protein
MNAFILFIVAAFSNATLEVSSPSFKNGGYIPITYTCEGKNINPAIEIKNIPHGTMTIALIVDDPDAPGGTFDHWVVWNIEPGKMINENSSPGMEGKNGAGKKGYMGPCPPAGTGIHLYHFKVYALDAKLDIRGKELLTAPVGKMELENTMKNHILARGELIGLYRQTKTKEK